MKRVITYLSILTVSLVVITINPVYSQDDVDWISFSKNLTANLTSENPGVRQSALELIIKYGDSLKLDEKSIFELVLIYLQSEEKYRQNALVKLYTLENKWAMAFIKRSIEFENDPTLRHTLNVFHTTYQYSEYQENNDFLQWLFQLKQ